ncbi:MAG: hypothetical protein ACRELF_13130 [Gemmataceae bacterium]
MSTENDVPLGESSRRYYEQQFGDRIHQIKKGGGSAPQRDSGGSNWNGRAGCGGILAVIFIIRLIAALVSSQSSTPSYNYSPPPQQQFNDDMRKQLDDLAVQDKAADKILKDLDEALRQGGQKNVPDFGVEDERDGAAKFLLTEADVPLLEGLCYRIYQESRQPGATPGKRVRALLPPSARQFLDKAARRQILRDNEREQMLEALNALLPIADLYNAASFQNVPDAPRALLNGIGDDPARSVPRFNRWLLEKCYPRQIVPLTERPRLKNEWERAGWKRRAQFDLELARQQYEAKKR